MNAEIARLHVFILKIAEHLANASEVLSHVAERKTMGRTSNKFKVIEPRPMPFAPYSERYKELFERWCREPQWTPSTPYYAKACRQCRSPHAKVNDVRLCENCTKDARADDKRIFVQGGGVIPGGVAKHEVDGQTTPLWAMVLSAAQQLSMPFTNLDLILFCWKQWPDVFGLTGMERSHPDSHKVLCVLSDKSGPIKSGWMERISPGVYKLTNAGLHWKR